MTSEMKGVSGRFVGVEYERFLKAGDRLRERDEGKLSQVVSSSMGVVSNKIRTEKWSIEGVVAMEDEELLGLPGIGIGAIRVLNQIFGLILEELDFMESSNSG